MNFDLTESQRLIREMARDFVEREVKPRAAEIDRSDEWPWDLYKRMADLGILGMTFPEVYGGSAADTVSWCIAQEELARGSAAVADAQLICKLMGDMILSNGSEEQRRKFVPAMARGEKICAIGVRLLRARVTFAAYPCTCSRLSCHASGSASTSSTCM